MNDEKTSNTKVMLKCQPELYRCKCKVMRSKRGCVSAYKTELWHRTDIVTISYEKKLNMMLFINPKASNTAMLKRNSSKKMLVNFFFSDENDG